MTEVFKVMCWILEFHPDSVKFVPNEYTLKSIAVYLEINTPENYCTMTMCYGVLFTLAVLQYYISEEEYLRCAVIIAAIKRMNDVYGCNLPTHIDSEWCKLNMGLSPLEMLENHFHVLSDKIGT